MPSATRKLTRFRTADCRGESRPEKCNWNELQSRVLTQGRCKWLLTRRAPFTESLFSLCLFVWISRTASERPSRGERELLRNPHLWTPLPVGAPAHKAEFLERFQINCLPNPDYCLDLSTTGNPWSEEFSSETPENRGRLRTVPSVRSP